MGSSEPTVNARPSSIGPESLEETVQPEQRRIPWRSRVGVALAAAGLLVAGACSGPEDAPTPTPSATHSEVTSTPTAAPLDVLPEFDTSRVENLISEGVWHMAGTTDAGDELVVTHTGQATLALQESGRPPKHPEYEPNPPVNLWGTHLKMERPGDIGFAARLENIKGEATFSILGHPNLRFDEHVYRQEGIDIVVSEAGAHIKVWQPSQPSPTYAHDVTFDKKTKSTDIAVMQTDGTLVVKIAGETVSVPAVVFKDEAWFSFDAEQSWNVTQFNAYPINGNRISLTDTSKPNYFDAKLLPDSPAHLAERHHGMKFGTAVDLPELMANPEYAKFILQNFNLIETELLAKFQALQPEEGKFNFEELDALVKFANEHGIEVHGHTLIFTEAYPKWLSDKLSDPNIPVEQKWLIVETYIQTVVTRYDGKHGHGLIKSWDVLNEVFDPDEWSELNKQSIYYKAFGPGYIERVLKTVRSANPDTTIFVNEWGAETDLDRRNALIDLVFRLHKAGLVDGVGLQSHFDEETLDDDEAMGEIYSGRFEQLLKRLGKERILVRLSEISVAENGDPETKAEVTAMLVKACANTPTCTDVNFWGPINSKQRFLYFTGDGYGRDPGDDAPASQAASGRTIKGITWRALEKALGN